MNINDAGLSPVGSRRNPGDTMDIGDSGVVQIRSNSQAPAPSHEASAVNAFPRKNPKMNEESFVDLLDHSTLQMEQRR